VAIQVSPLFAGRGRLLALAAALALLTAACGRYGPLEPPPDPNAPPKPANSNPASPAGVFAKPSIPPIKAPDRPFFLDFLLK
jgi:predicted small lipoprotein YifL